MERKGRSLVSSFFGKKKGGSPNESHRMGSFGLATVFSYEELKKATNDFDASKVLGGGGYGRVYSGNLRGRIVAVKKLYDDNPKLLEQFFNEVTVLSRIRHANLVTLHGCSHPHTRELLLVYEFVPNGTVAEHLHGKLQDLTWPVRLQIAIESAEALSYLHALEPPVIHRDVKTSNILLDDEFHVKVADLGICRLLPWDTTDVSTLPQGTMGYRDPEYDLLFRLTDKTDVYSFGVVLFELISGKEAVDVHRAPTEIYLARMALAVIQNKKLTGFVDPKLGYASDSDVRRMVDSVAELACQCLQPEGKMRPSMVQALTILKGIKEYGIEHTDAKDVGSSGYRKAIESPGPSTDLQDKGVDEAGLVKEGEDGRSRDSTKASRDNEQREGTKNKLVFLNGGKSKPMFELEEVFRASSDKVGKGSIATVYRARLDDGQQVAVKRMQDAAVVCSRKEFDDCMELISYLSHPNLVPIRAYYFSQNEKLFISDYLPNGSLHYHLHETKGLGRNPLDWTTRFSIVLGVARGLAHIHNSSPAAIHGSVKSSNVFLDENGVAGMSDFCLEKLLSPAQAIERLGAYRAPELAGGSEKISQAADVYGFGVLLLEVLKDWVQSRVREEWTSKVFDLEQMRYENVEDEMVVMLQIGFDCVSTFPPRRPKMQEVVRMIEDIRADRHNRRWSF